MELAKRCFKVDRSNAQAMIAGLPLPGNIHHQAIWLDVAEKPFPMLITLQRTRTRFRLSELGMSLPSEGFSIPYVYVAALDSEYFIRNDIDMWETLCSNGLFNIWDPIAPYNRLAGSKTDPSRFRIQLLRIYEIEQEFSKDDIVAASTRIDHLVAPNRTVTIRGPVVADEEFEDIRATLVSSVSPYLSGARLGSSTSQIRKDSASLEFEDDL